MRGPIFIYDPNYTNPYGLELASTIRQATGRPVELWVPRNRGFSSSAGLLTRPVLGDESAGGTAKLIQRLISPMRLIWAARREDLVVVWTRDIFDALIFALRASIGLRTYFIYHNPPAIRQRSGLSGLGERLLARVATVCVHSEQLKRAVDGSARHVLITPHPSYATAIRNRTDGAVQLEGHSNSTMRVALVGGLRPDKGVARLPDIARASGGGWELVLAGPDRLPEEMTRRLHDFGVSVVQPFSGVPTDSQLYSVLERCDVMIAPYSSVTESGSIILAHSLGVPTLAIASSALSVTMNERSLAADAPGLGELLREFRFRPWATFSQTPAERQLRAIDSWRLALE